MNPDFRYRSRRSNVLATHGMVATSQPLAAQAGLDMLKSGGTAADAAVAAAAVLCVVEPVSTGIGGDCFALYWDAREKRVTALNGSGSAPMRASMQKLRDLGYTAMPRFTGHAVTLPGAVAGWADLLMRHGQKALMDVLEPAIALADEGFPVSEVIAKSWELTVDKLLRRPGWPSGDLDNGPEQPSGRELLVADASAPGGARAPRPGEMMRLPTLAATLRDIARHGPDAIYGGDFARKLCDHVRAYGGWLAPEDLSSHTSSWDDPVSAGYRGATLYECPPNGQGLAALLALSLAREFDLAAMSEADRVHHLVECTRLAFADAMRYVCDPNYAKAPAVNLLGDACIRARRALIDPAKAAASVEAGELPGGADTVYISAVDGAGNACSFIQSLYMGTGTGLVVPGTGVSLQNRGAGFSLDPAHPNALAPGKRPYHTIIPAMSVRDGALHACFGVMGGFMQPQGHMQMMVNMLDLGMSPQAALDAPRWQLAVTGGKLGADEPGGEVLLEDGFDAATADELRRRGHKLRIMAGFDKLYMGGGQIVARDPVSGVLTAGSDPRKDGCAAGW